MTESFTMRITYEKIQQDIMQGVSNLNEQKTGEVSVILRNEKIGI